MATRKPVTKARTTRTRKTATKRAAGATRSKAKTATKRKVAAKKATTKKTAAKRTTTKRKVAKKATTGRKTAKVAVRKRKTPIKPIAKCHLAFRPKPATWSLATIGLNAFRTKLQTLTSNVSHSAAAGADLLRLLDRNLGFPLATLNTPRAAGDGLEARLRHAYDILGVGEFVGLARLLLGPSAFKLGVDRFERSLDFIDAKKMKSDRVNSTALYEALRANAPTDSFRLNVFRPHVWFPLARLMPFALFKLHLEAYVQGLEQRRVKLGQPWPGVQLGDGVTFETVTIPRKPELTARLVATAVAAQSGCGGSQDYFLNREHNLQGAWETMPNYYFGWGAKAFMSPDMFERRVERLRMLAKKTGDGYDVDSACDSAIKGTPGSHPWVGDRVSGLGNGNLKTAFPYKLLMTAAVRYGLQIQAERDGNLWKLERETQPKPAKKPAERVVGCR